MPRRILITGAAGFVGQWLVRRLVDENWTVFGGTIEGPPSPRIVEQSRADRVCWLPLNVLDRDEIVAAVATSRPDAVVHLAGIAFPPDANASPARAFEINTLGALHLLETLKKARESAGGGGGDAAWPRVLVVGSAEQYGMHAPDDCPLPETASLNPVTAYAASKAAQELVALQVFRGSGLPVICTRSFNHSGDGHGANFLLPSLVARAVRLPKSGGALRIGNESPIRDYLHVTDVVRAYTLLLERGTPGEVYNVCSGKGISVRQLAERVLIRLGTSAEISVDPALVRPIDVPILVGDNGKLRGATGWAPERTVDDIIDDLIHAATH